MTGSTHPTRGASASARVNRRMVEVDWSTVMMAVLIGQRLRRVVEGHMPIGQGVENGVDWTEISPRFDVDQYGVWCVVDAFFSAFRGLLLSL